MCISRQFLLLLQCITCFDTVITSVVNSAFKISCKYGSVYMLLLYLVVRVAAAIVVLVVHSDISHFSAALTYSFFSSISFLPQLHHNYLMFSIHIPYIS